MSLPFPVLTAEEAAEFISHGQNIGFSGFTPAGAAKAVPAALAKKALREHAAGFDKAIFQRRFLQAVAGAMAAQKAPPPQHAEGWS